MLKSFKPITPSRRFMTMTDYSVITKTEPEKSLVHILPKHGGRSHGKVSMRGQGGESKRFYRMVDFGRKKKDIEARVSAIEYDPNRTAFLALLQYEDGEKRYILKPEGLKIGDTVTASVKAEIKPGNALPLSKMPIGTIVHNVEITPGKGGQIVRSAGTGALIVAREGGFVHIKMPSGEMRKIRENCWATVGQLGNTDWKEVKFGKAGRRRKMGKRPKVRGVAMSPRDHPHGGGEGRSGIGMSSPKSPWGKPTLGKRTRNKKKYSKRYIITRRRK